MTVIRPNSVSGITSLTALGNSIDFYNASGSGIEFNNVNLNNTSGVSTFNSIDVTSIVGVSTIGVTTAYVTNINDGPIAGTRNRVINGGMQIWQRGTSNFTTLNSFAYAADRFFMFSGVSMNATSAQVTGIGLTEFQYAMRAQRNSGNSATSALLIGQTIESSNCFDLAGKQVTLSFWARAGSNYSASSNALLVSLVTGTGTDQGTLSFINSGWTGQSTTIMGTATLTTSWQRFSFSIFVPVGTNEIAFYFYEAPTGTAGTNDYFDITGVQLEEGPIATPFERRSYGQEFALCCRYYEIIETGGNTPLRFGNDGMCISSTVALFQVGGFYPKRSTPVATLSAGNTFAVVNSAGNLIQGTASNVINYGFHNASVTVTVASGLTAGNSAQLYAAAGQTGRIQLSSEL